jgi:hypothetical protein
MANATLPGTANRRVILGAVLAAGALAAVPSRASAAPLGVDQELRAVIDAWHQAHRQLEETYDASCEAEDRASACCPFPQALIATERDGKFWSDPLPGRQYQEADVSRMRALTALACRFDDVFSCTGYDDRVREIISSWDRWHANKKAAQEREGVPEADARWKRAVEIYHATGNCLAKQQAKTIAGVIAKLLAAASEVIEDDLRDDNNSYAAVLAGAALDAQALVEAQSEEALT